MSTNKERYDALQKLIQPISVLEAIPYIRLVLYGEFGVGKTIAACSLIDCSPDNKRGLLVSQDPGWVSLRNTKHKEVADRIDLQEYKGTEQLLTLAEGALSGELKDLDGEPYGLLILDTVSGMYEDYVDWLMDNYFYSKNYRDKAIPRDNRSKLEALETPGQPDYHLARNALRPIIRAIMAAPIDVVLTAHVREPGPLAQPGDIAKRPAIANSIHLLMGRQTHLEGYMTRDGVSRKISFETRKSVIAKSRLDFLDGKVIEADSLPSLLKDWKNKK